jgi:hypothetical protein
VKREPTYEELKARVAMLEARIAAGSAKHAVQDKQPRDRDFIDYCNYIAEHRTSRRRKRGRVVVSGAPPSANIPSFMTSIQQRPWARRKKKGEKGKSVRTVQGGLPYTNLRRH